LSEFGFLSDSLTLILLVGGLGIFGYLAVLAKSIKKFQFQLSVFILIWILGEIASQLQSSGVISENFAGIGLEIHLASMVFFAVLVWIRFLSSRNQNKNILDDANDMLK
jgi:membrane associated rhomboid family serine protease